MLLGFRVSDVRVLALGVAGAALAGRAGAAPSVAELAAQADWRAAIEHVSAPTDGCYAAAYPVRSWRRVACVAAPRIPFLPRGLGRAAGQTVGNGADYSALTATLTQSATGSFPKVSGLTSETGVYGANDYSLQLNSGFMNTAGCNGGGAGCLTWQQFIYSVFEKAVFMQYWLINYGSTCPDSSWASYAGSCYKNSAMVGAPQIAATDLGKLKIKGTAAAGGMDTVTLIGPTSAYVASGLDSVVDLATAWNQSEFNIVGDGGGSQANFNPGTSVTVAIRVKDGSTAAPVCAANTGTTAETNNLNLRACYAVSGTVPGIHFVEKN